MSFEQERGVTHTFESATKGSQEAADAERELGAQVALNAAYVVLRNETQITPISYDGTETVIQVPAAKTTEERYYLPA